MKILIKAQFGNFVNLDYILSIYKQSKDEQYKIIAKAYHEQHNFILYQSDNEGSTDKWLAVFEQKLGELSIMAHPLSVIILDITNEV